MTTATRLATTLATSTDWMQDGLCRQVDADLFFPDSVGNAVRYQIARARTVCNRCPVLVECREYALATDQRFGVWGGLSEDERRALKEVEAA